MNKGDIYYFTNISYTNHPCIVTHHYFDSNKGRIEISLDLMNRTNPFYINISQIKNERSN